MDQFNVVIRDKTCADVLARLAEAQIREPEQQLNWEVERMLLRLAKPDGRSGGQKRGPRGQNAAA